MMRIGRAMAVLGAFLCVGWLCGFAWFVYSATRPAPPPPQVADGIVALTGGADRIESALRLFASGRGRLLLVSGMGRGRELGDFAHRAGVPIAQLDQRVTLGHIATTTVGNAIETAAWARANGVRTLIVVTAGYHMPRALLEIGRALPDVTLYPVPVTPPALREPAAPTTLRMLAGEYTKWIVVGIGLSRVLARPDAPA